MGSSWPRSRDTVPLRFFIYMKSFVQLWPYLWASVRKNNPILFTTIDPYPTIQYISNPTSLLPHLWRGWKGEGWKDGSFLKTLARFWVIKRSVKLVCKICIKQCYKYALYKQKSSSFATFLSYCYLLIRYSKASFCYCYSATFLNFCKTLYANSYCFFVNKCRDASF
jgi:hypothetical protein